MAVTLTAVLDPPKLAARLDVGGIPAGSDTLTIERTSPSGNVAGVRGAVGRVVGGTSLIVRDYEVPFDVSVSYTITVYDGTTVVGTASAIFRIDYTECEVWLVDLARPPNSLPLVIESFRELAFPIPAGIHRVLNRRAPVVVALPAYTPASELIVLTDTLDERNAVRNLLGAGYPFLLRTDPAQGVGNMYLALTDFVEERFLTDGYAAQRRFRIACVQVERPDPEAFSPSVPNLYSNVKATFANYTAVKAGVPNYDALAFIYPSGSTGPVIPWLPDDV